MADDRSLVVKVIPAIFCSIAFLTVLLRCYVRVFVVKAFGVDDGAMVLSMVGRLSILERIGILTSCSAMLHHVLRLHDWRCDIRYWKEVRRFDCRSTNDCDGGTMFPTREDLKNKVANKLAVLVALRNSLLLLICLLQNIRLCFSDAYYYSQNPHLSPILRHVVDSHRRTHSHVPDAFTMQAHLLLLDSHCLGSDLSGTLHQYGHYYQHDLCL